MKYEIKKAGKTYYSTICEKAPYDRLTEKNIQAAGYDIYIDGCKKRR